MKNKIDFLNDLENNPKEIQDTIEEFWRKRISERYHMTSKFLYEELGKRELNWEKMHAIDRAIRDFWEDFMRDKYENSSNDELAIWLRERYGKVTIYSKYIKKLYPDTDIPRKTTVMYKWPVKLEKERDLNKFKWDRTPVEPYWKDCWEIVEVWKRHIDVKLNPYSWVPIIL